MLIAIVHDHKSFMPETTAYRQFFMHKGFEVVITTPEKLSTMRPAVEWHFMGTHWKRSAGEAIVIHEYASASMPPCRKLKDVVKRTFMVKPHYRLFLNEYVKESFHFRDSVPFGYRDMGLWPQSSPTDTAPLIKEYDFIYTGSVTPDIRIDLVLDRFTTGQPLADHTILVLSKSYEQLRDRYKDTPNIRFSGPVAQQEVAGYIQKAKFAINFKPDKEPHSHQTVTKLLEYATHKTPIITSNLAWVRDFQQQYGGEFFYLDPDLGNFTWEAVNTCHYSFPDLSAWTWEHQINRSGILEFLRAKLNRPDL